MAPTRRDVAVAAAATFLTPPATRADAGQPVIIALSESAATTRSDFLAAIQAGADFLETALLPSQDGALIASSQRELSGYTDVADRFEFAGRRTSKPVHGATQPGWFVEDFTLAELKTLSVRKPRRRDRDNADTLMTFQDVVDIARAASVRAARVVGVYVGLSESGYFASIGAALEPRLADAIAAAGYNSPAAAMFVHASEAETLNALRGLARSRLVRRVAADDPRASDITSGDVLATIRAYADAVAPDAELLAAAGVTQSQVVALVMKCRAAGLDVHAWAPVPKAHANDLGDRLVTLFRAGVAGVASDAPRAAVEARRKANRR